MKRVAVVRLADPVGTRRHDRALEALCRILPRVGVLDEGVFACDLRGTERLLGSPERVGQRIVETLGRSSIACAVGIAARPFPAHALADRTASGAVAELDDDAERAFLDALSLEALPLDEDQRDELRLLGIRTAGAFAELDPGAVLDRFGRAVAAAHALARGEDDGAVRAAAPRRRIGARRAWDDPMTTRDQLLFALRTVLDEVAAELSGEGLAALRLDLRLDRERRGPLRLERVVLPPTADPAALLRSLRWGLDELLRGPGEADLGAVVGAQVEASEVASARGRQVGLFAPDGAREEEAIAVVQHLRSRLGPGAVVRPRVVDADARLPERAAEWDEVVA